MNVKAGLLLLVSLLPVVSPWGPMVDADSRGGSSAAGIASGGIRIGDLQVGGSHISGAVGSGRASAQAVISGGDGVIVIQGDRVVVEGGRLSLNGVPYGRVGPSSMVRFSVSGGVKRLFVDGVERRPR